MENRMDKTKNKGMGIEVLFGFQDLSGELQMGCQCNETISYEAPMVWLYCHNIG